MWRSFNNLKGFIRKVTVPKNNVAINKRSLTNVAPSETASSTTDLARAIKPKKRKIGKARF